MSKKLSILEREISKISRNSISQEYLQELDGRDPQHLLWSESQGRLVGVFHDDSQGDMEDFIQLPEGWRFGATATNVGIPNESPLQELLEELLQEKGKSIHDEAADSDSPIKHLAESLRQEGYLVFAVRAYQHGGKALRVYDYPTELPSGQFADRWDSYWAGMLIAPASAVENPETARQWIDGFIESYNLLEQGQVYGFVVVANHGNGPEEVDSCWGYLGHDDYLDAMADEFHGDEAPNDWALVVEDEAIAVVEDKAVADKQEAVYKQQAVNETVEEDNDTYIVVSYDVGDLAFKDQQVMGFQSALAHIKKDMLEELGKDFCAGLYGRDEAITTIGAWDGVSSVTFDGNEIFYLSVNMEDKTVSATLYLQDPFDYHVVRVQ